MPVVTEAPERHATSTCAYPGCRQPAVMRDPVARDLAVCGRHGRVPP